jgi:hypothetical protein
MTRDVGEFPLFGLIKQQDLLGSFLKVLRIIDLITSSKSGICVASMRSGSVSSVILLLPLFLASRQARNSRRARVWQRQNSVNLYIGVDGHRFFCASRLSPTPMPAPSPRPRSFHHKLPCRVLLL